MKSVFLKRLASYFTILVYSSTVLFSGHSQAKGFYRPQMKQAVEAFNQASALAKKTGDTDLISRVFGFKGENAEFVKKHLGANAPSIKVDKSEIVVAVEGGDPIKMKIVNLEKGEFLVNGLKFVYNPSESFEKATERMIPLAQAKGYGANSFWNLLVPSAHAFEFDSKAFQTIVIAVVALLAVGVLVWAWNKSSERKAETDRLNAANSHEQTMANISIEKGKAESASRVNEHKAGITHGESDEGGSDSVSEVVD